MIKYEVNVYTDGSIHWYLDGKRHCEHGPAFIDSDGSYAHYINGNLHCEDGPASVSLKGNYKYWYLDGLEYTEEEFNAEMSRRKPAASSCDGKIVEIEGKKYRLTEV